MPAADTSALALAARLRSQTDDALIALLGARGVREKRLADFFDLAEALLDRDSVHDALHRLDRPTLAVLAALHLLGPSPLAAVRERLARSGTAPGAVTLAERAERVRALALADLDGDTWFVYDAVGALLEAWPDDSLPAPDALVDTAPPAALEPVATADARFVDRAAGERAFATTTALGELVAELARTPARGLAKGGIALPDAKRLAEAMGTSLDAVTPLRELAEHAELVARVDGAWHATPHALAWRSGTAVERWTHLATGWLHRVPADLRDVLARRSHAVWGDGLAAYLAWFYPAGGDWLAERVALFTDESDLLGITSAHATSTPGAALVEHGPAEAAAAIAPLFPAEVDRVYVQHDLTVVAPGPLAAAVDVRLRGMADVEARGLASTYRVTRSSVGRALATGETADTIRAFLTEVSLTGIPQPLDYLVTDTASRFGSLRVGALDEPDRPSRRTYVRADDTNLVGTVAVDTTLSTLSLERTGDHRLVSRFDLDVVFWALADAGYPVVAEDADGRIVPSAPKRTASGSAPVVVDDPVPGIVARLREAGAAAPEESGTAWVARQLELAARSKLAVVVTVRMPDGSEQPYQLEPASIVGGRLRARDRRADIERTLPLSAIVAVASL